MKFPWLKTLLLAPLLLFALLYMAAAVLLATRDAPEMQAFANPPATPYTIAIFGASGTAGDGILKAALAADEVGAIHVITRRETPRIAAGVASGKVQMILHTDYLDYSAIEDTFTDVDAVFWAIGISSLGVDEETYGRIHVDFPTQFVSMWNRVSSKEGRSFHFISSSDISEESETMWVRQKIRAEKSLFGLAQGTDLKVIAYRPDYIGPTREETHLGQDMLYWFFKPVGAAVRATQIGQSMIAVSMSGDEFANGAKLSTLKIIQYSDAYELSK